ncbi:NADH-quinone oxidoreductase subunit L [Kineosporia rhizophila]|uniref:NADH-quinone oxidoreductase subunit L n=1 Tax=Kineosporia TaxID=49184 RepID=UPI001E38C5CE|nr:MULTISPECIES: NADH-quinone oxidoreductase subunit L [Kineosporia]MCE0540546.1 NADH-quinone oxidoreductase subunit L [Kineosporia rhizophila]GLY13274.1 NADH-quinone oxidoreductase subunit L [Kineosporia sp. NBRC 101677]
MLAETGAYHAAEGTVQSGAWLLIALPALGAAVLLLGGRRLDRWGHWLGVLMSWAAFVWGALLFFDLLGRDGEERAVQVHLFEWIHAGAFQLDAGLLVDPLSLAFVLLVTFVGSLIHVYSVAYMEHDPDRRRFFAYLNLFVASMLLLVLADSYLLLFVGWEGVGLASYLLIGFWNHNPAYATAAKKAFIVNRVGDVGLSLAIMAMFLAFGTVTFSGVFAEAGNASEAQLTVIGLLLLVGACGKSAQFPLQSWLGDAMAGPTPVSALIHAATMVTAGVYLVVRSMPVYVGAPDAQLVVVVVGAITLVYGAIVGCAKDDIKKALAASTMSQIGYMMLAAGLGPVGAAFAIFHLLTHGFFKAGMFLGAGSVMHGMNDSVNMRTFGRLSGVMKITWVTFGLGWLAIIGFPFLSGFWSKDKIIESAFVGEGWRPWVFGLTALLAAGVTAFYMSRLFFMTFQGKEKRWADDAHPHESPALMTVPMMILAVGSAFLGLALGVSDGLVHWLEPVIGHAEHHEPVLSVPVITGSTLVLVALGVFLAWRMYWNEPVPRTAPRGSLLTRAARRDLFQDDVNEGLFMRPGQYLTRTLVFVDNKGVDGAVGGLAALVGGLGGRLRRVQTGLVRSYAASMLAGVVILLGGLLAVRL